MPSSLELLAHKSAIEDEVDGCPVAASQPTVTVAGAAADFEDAAGRVKPDATAAISDDSDSDQGGVSTGLSRQAGVDQVGVASMSSPASSVVDSLLSKIAHETVF